MSLLDAAEALHRQPGGHCSVGLIARDDPALAQELRDALARPEVLGSDIARALTDRGVRVGVYTVNRHRRGECLCRPS